jgi:hypothetical protein
MDSLIICFLPTILALGIVTSYEDIKEGKIRNKYIIAATLLSVTINCLLYYFGFVEITYLLRISAYFLASLAVGFALWLVKIWSAGDAKLFAAFSILVPLDTYRFRTTPLPTIEILINAILPLFFYTAAKMIIGLGEEKKVEVIKQIFDPKRLGMALLAIFGISWLTRLCFSTLGLVENYLISVLIIMILLSLMRKVLEIKEIYGILVLLAVIRIFIDQKWLLSWGFVISLTKMTIIYIIVNFISGLGKYAYKKKKISELKAGDVLLQAITKEGFKTDTQHAGSKAIFVPTGEGLRQKELKKIQSSYRRGLLNINKIRVRKMTHFALFLFAGTLITLACEGNIIMFLRSTL